MNHKCEESVPNPHTCEESVPNPHNCEKWYQNITCEKMLSELTRVKNCYQILTRVIKVYQIITYMKNWYLIVIYVSKNFVCKMQQTRGGVHFINMRNTHTCYMKFDFVRILQSVRYWYEMYDVLVPILNSVKFMKCEIRGSTMRTYLLGQEVYILALSWLSTSPEQTHF